MENENTSRTHLLSNKLYDVLKLLALVIFPALGTLYLALDQIWGLPAAEKVVGTIVALDAFLGVIIKIGDASYNASDARYDGAMVVEKTATGVMNSLVLNDDPAKLEGKKEIILKVAPTAVPVTKTGS